MVDKYELAPEFLKISGLVKNQLHSFNYFVETKLKKIVLASDEIRSTQDPTIYLRYVDARIGVPSHITHLSPQECRLSDRTYDVPVYATIEYTVKVEETKKKRKEVVIGRMPDKDKTDLIKKEVVIGRMPLMLRSSPCMLNGKTENQLTELGECPLDPGGYFVIKGIEKVILIQEQLRKNRIMIDRDKMGCVQASVISSTKETESTTVIKVEKEKIYLKSDEFERKIPIMIFLRAMGIEHDEEVLQMIGADYRFIELLRPSIEECADLKVYTQLQALKFIESDKMLQVSSHSTGPVEKGARALRILRDIIFANVPVPQNNFHRKCMYVTVMLRRIMEAILDNDAVDDKDYLGSKRYELCADLLSPLFEDLFMQLNKEVSKTVDALLAKRRRVDISQLIVRPTITAGLERSFSTGNWNVKQLRMHRIGVTQVVSRLSYTGLLAQMTRIVAQVGKSSEVCGPSARAVHGSQFGMLCPCDTPTGEACGLVKHLALMTHVTLTIDEDENPIVSLVEHCSSLGVEDLEQLSPELHMPGSYLIILNGVILGKHRRPQKFVNDMRKRRRNGQIGKFVSIFLNEKQGSVYIASDGGRVCRPLVIAESGVSRIKERHMEELRKDERNFDSFVRDGLIEFLDVDEENNSLVCVNQMGSAFCNKTNLIITLVLTIKMMHVFQIALCEGEAKPETTHIEIEKFTILGVCAGMIPYLDHNNSVWSTYQCAMGKQVMGNIAYNQLSRMDKLINLLVYPQRPLLTTRTTELVGYDKLGAGQNAIVAVMSYGYGSGNAIVMNKSSVDRGFGRCIVMKRYSAIRQKYENFTSDQIIRPQREGNEADIMQILDDDGLAAPGEIIRPHDIYINKVSPTITTGVPYWQLQDSPPMKQSRQTYKGPEGETTAVDRVALYSDNHDNLCIKLMIRHTRRPEIGDKFSCRHGHKGVCGLIVQQEDFPFSELGICPDLIINPHGFTDRLTVGKMKELLGSKAGALEGRFYYGTAFSKASGVEKEKKGSEASGVEKEKKGSEASGVEKKRERSRTSADVVNVEAISETLVANSYNYNGKDFLYSGTQGTPIHAYIFTGPIYYQKLKHMVMDKMQVHATGRRDIVTRQLIEGVRVGEMERDCLISYGASSLINERLMISSDPFEAQVCRKCGLLGYYNYKRKIGICSMCKNGENISTVKMPHAFKSLIQELQSMNIIMQFKLAEEPDD